MFRPSFLPEAGMRFLWKKIAIPIHLHKNLASYEQWTSVLANPHCAPSCALGRAVLVLRSGPARWLCSGIQAALPFLKQVRFKTYPGSWPVCDSLRRVMLRSGKQKVPEVSSDTVRFLPASPERAKMLRASRKKPSERFPILCPPGGNRAIPGSHDRKSSRSFCLASELLRHFKTKKPPGCSHNKTSQRFLNSNESDGT